MSLESFAEDEKKKKEEQSEKEKKMEALRFLRFRQWKELLQAHIYTKEKLDKLRFSLEGIGVREDIKKIVEMKDTLNDEELENIFSCIDEIENLPDIDAILPKDFRITHEDYMTALRNPEKRGKVIDTLTSALSFLSTSIYPQGLTPLSIFLSFFARLDKNLILVQEHTITLKRSLQ